MADQRNRGNSFSDLPVVPCHAVDESRISLDRESIIVYNLKMKNLNVPTTTIRVKYALRDILKRAAKKKRDTLEVFVEDLILSALNAKSKR